MAEKGGRFIPPFLFDTAGYGRILNVYFSPFCNRSTVIHAHRASPAGSVRTTVPFTVTRSHVNGPALNFSVSRFPFVFDRKRSGLHVIFRIGCPVADFRFAAGNGQVVYFDVPCFRQPGHDLDDVALRFRSAGRHQDRPDGFVLLHEIAEIALAPVHSLLPAVRRAFRDDERLRQPRAVTHSFERLVRNRS